LALKNQSVVVLTNYNYKTVIFEILKEDVIKILFESFYDNKSVNYAIRQGHKDKSLLALLEYSVKEGERYGKVYLNDDPSACAILLDSNKKRMTFKTFLDQIKLIKNSIGLGNLFKIWKREKLIHARHPKERYIHLWYIGVSKKYQNQGRGSALLTKILNDHKGVPFYLETTTEEYSHFYEKLGFVKTEVLDLGHDLIFYKNDNHE